MIDTATDPWGIDIERVEVMIPNADIETRFVFLAPISVPQGERCATASKPAEGNGGRGGGHEGGEGQGDKHLVFCDFWPNPALYLITPINDNLQVIAAEGEQKASRALKEASDIISESPAALQLRS